MRDEERLTALLDAWQEAQSHGEELSPEDLCRDCTSLLPELSRRIEVLRRFDVLRGSTEDPLVAPFSLLPPSPPSTPFPMRAVSRLPKVGEEFGGYHIVVLLGDGGMGCVYQATDPVLDREVALKVMRPKLAARAWARERFLREARAMAALHHDHVVPIYQVGEVHGVPFLAMPLLQGETLAARLDRAMPLPVAELLRIGVEVAAGLAAVHAQGLIHCDLTPANIWLESQAANRLREVPAAFTRAKLLDFGLAHEQRRAAGTAEQTLFGTPAYMSPEQAEGKPLDGRADLFSLGSVFYECATGQRAFAGKSLTAVLAAVAQHQPPPAHEINPAVPMALSKLIDQLLAKSPHDRPASAEVVAEALRVLATWPEYDRRSRSLPDHAPPRRWLPAVGTLFVVALVRPVGYLALKLKGFAAEVRGVCYPFQGK